MSYRTFPQEVVYLKKGYNVDDERHMMDEYWIRYYKRFHFEPYPQAN